MELFEELFPIVHGLDAHAEVMQQLPSIAAANSLLHLGSTSSTCHLRTM